MNPRRHRAKSGQLREHQARKDHIARLNALLRAAKRRPATRRQNAKAGASQALNRAHAFAFATRADEFSPRPAFSGPTDADAPWLILFSSFPAQACQPAARAIAGVAPHLCVAFAPQGAAPPDFSAVVEKALAEYNAQETLARPAHRDVQLWHMMRHPFIEGATLERGFSFLDGRAFSCMLHRQRAQASFGEISLHREPDEKPNRRLAEPRRTKRRSGREAPSDWIALCGPALAEDAWRRGISRQAFKSCASDFATSLQRCVAKQLRLAGATDAYYLSGLEYERRAETPQQLDELCSAAIRKAFISAIERQDIEKASATPPSSRPAARL